MADGGTFSFDLTGLDAIVGRLDQLENDIDRRLEEKLTKIAAKVIHDAKRLAPLGTPDPSKPDYSPGDLEASLIMGEVKRTIEGMYIEMGTSPEVDDYAVVQHEGFRKTSKGKIVRMTPGENTRSKGNYNGYSPGKKFLENAIKMNEEEIIKELSGLLEGW